MFTIIKELPHSDFKVLKYFGLRLKLPNGPGYVVTDSEGIVYLVTGCNRPSIKNDCWCFKDKQIKQVAFVKFLGDWKDSLIEAK